MLIPLIVACTPVDLGSGTSTSEVEDLRFDLPAPPEGGEQFVSPEYVIPALSEKQFCYFFEYQGDEVGINFQGNYQGQFGHHVLLLKTNATEEMFPNGTILDCTERDVLPMTDIEPLVVGSTFEDNVGELWLPEGMATKLKGGTRLVLQSHYVNAITTDILVQDAVNLGYMPVDEVQTWAAAFAQTTLDLVVPPLGDATYDIDCTWEDDVNLLFLAGHMHEQGSTMWVDHHRSGGDPERVYEVETWDPYFRDVPPVNEYGVDTFAVAAGDRFVTHCEWNNQLDHEMLFPEEMCAIYGMAYPSTIPLICTD